MPLCELGAAAASNKLLRKEKAIPAQGISVSDNLGFLGSRSPHLSYKAKLVPG